MWTPPCYLCGHNIADGCRAPGMIPKHSACAHLEQTMPRFRLRRGLLGQTVVQILRGIHYVDLDIMDVDGFTELLAAERPFFTRPEPSA